MNAILLKGIRFVSDHIMKNLNKLEHLSDSLNEVLNYCQRFYTGG